MYDHIDLPEDSEIIFFLIYWYLYQFKHFQITICEFLPGDRRERIGKKSCKALNLKTFRLGLILTSVFSLQRTQNPELVTMKFSVYRISIERPQSCAGIVTVASTALFF